MPTDILAVIPARGGSKGIPRKNVKLMHEKPLILWTLEQAINELGTSSVLVSSDSKEIQEIVADAGHKFTTYNRPKSLATDEASTEPVLSHALDWYRLNTGREPEFLMLLQPTSPVRKPGRLLEALEFLKTHNCDSVLSVVRDHAFFWKNRDKPIPTYNPSKRPRRQDISIEDEVYRENGSIYVTKTKSFFESGCRISGDTRLFEMSQEESYEIDTPTDWLINEALLREI